MLYRVKKQFFLFFMPGFILGILYVNFLASRYMAVPGLFNESFLLQFASLQIDPKDYIWYLLRLRAVPFLVLSGLAFTKFRRISAVLFLFWAGISGGVLISAAVLEMGLKGSVFCIAALCPQFLFYIPALYVLLRYCFCYEESIWNRQKTIFVILSVLAGIILELYVNPVLLKAVISIL